MAAVIVTRIDATRRLLVALSTRTFDGGDEFKAVSKKQRCALEALMAATTITASEAASIAEALASVPFTGTDATVLMDLVSEALSSTSTNMMHLPIGRRPQQNYSTFTSFMVRSLWDQIIAHPSQAMQLILQFLHDHLALRSIHEPTFAKIAAVVLLIELGYHGAMVALESTLTKRYRDCKADFATLAKRSGVDIWLTKLPLSPLTLVQDMPDLARRVWFHESPVSCPLSEAQVSAVLKRIKMRGNPSNPSYNEGCQLAVVNPDMGNFQHHVQPFLAEMVREMNALKRERFNLQSDSYDWNEGEQWPITIMNGFEGGAKGAAKGEIGVLKDAAGARFATGKGALPAWPAIGKGAAVPDGDAAGATAPPATPLKPVRQEEREAVKPVIVGETDTPSKALQPGVVTGARKSVLDTLSAVRQAYDKKAKKDDDDDEKPSMMRKPAAASKNRKAAASSNPKIAAKPAASIVETKNKQKVPKKGSTSVVQLCEQASRSTFCCRAPDGGKLFSYKTKSRKRAQDDAVTWIKAECKKLRVPVPNSKFID